MKNQILAMCLAWAVSVGLIPESTTSTITDFVGINGYEKPFELAAVIVLGFLFQTLKPLLELIPRLSQKYADKITDEFNLTSGVEDKRPRNAATKRSVSKRTPSSKGE